MNLDSFEPGWKRSTVSIKRTLNVVTYIHDQFLDDRGNVVKELRHEKRSLHKPVMVTPAWMAPSLQSPEYSQQAPGDSMFLSPCSESPSSLHNVQRISVSDAVEVQSESSNSEMLQLEPEVFEPPEPLNIKNFAFWDAPQLRTCRVAALQKTYIPVYVCSRGPKTTEVQVVVSPIQTSRKYSAKRNDLIYLDEIQQFQTFRFSEQQLGNIFPGMKGFSDHGIKSVAYISPVSSSKTQENLHLELKVKDGSQDSKISFWNCTLPSTASVVLGSRKSSLDGGGSKKFEGDLPHVILEKKRGRLSCSKEGSSSSVQRVCLDLGDPDDDGVEKPQRPRKVGRPPARSSSSAREEGSQQTSAPQLTTPVTTPTSFVLDNLFPVPHLLSNHTFYITFSKSDEMNRLEKVITHSGGSVVAKFSSLLQHYHKKKNRYVISDKFIKKLWYSQAIASGIPIVNSWWLSDCLANKCLVPIDKARHLIKSRTWTGFDKDQPYMLTNRKRPLSGRFIAVWAETNDVYDQLTFLLSSLGANFRQLDLRQPIPPQVASVSYILLFSNNSSQTSQISSVAPNTPILTAKWLMDCVNCWNLIDYKTSVSYFSYSPEK